MIGCVDTEACNFNSLANVDHGCIYSIEYYDCDNLCNSDTDNDGVCDELEIVGCMDQTAFNYNELATDPADCEPLIFGCTDATQYNYNPEANTENGSCISYIDGCTDSTAFNYDPLATADNGSCIEIVEGCADIEAVNYNSLVNIPNNDVCLYDAGCIGEPGDPYYLNDSCYAWIINIDSYCCEVGWDAACINLYEYCEQGWPTGVPEINTGITLYPNPTSTILNIQTSLDVVTEVYNAQGNL